METKSVVFIDSNYWIYLFDKTCDEHAHVKRLGPTVAKEKWQVFSSIDFVIGNLKFEQLDPIFEVLSKFSHTGIGGRDATILSFMEEKNITKLCTHDKAFTKIPNIEIIDPIP